ncbi:GTP-binding protein [Arboricoccus pini]|uniref:Probable GTP-binding protein EngB n=1 Tax=Arboricoccus pini TaxID=1963835 RepID=A0A212Q1R5_9PROT|nr:ribosome biogenesis GTP-binding protein YihA/YsxC [Arboricoccus pini]SNB53246.1 GTP-binding protein [Arboricoccus pini]
MQDLNQPTPEALEEGRLLFAQACTFMLGVVNLRGLPPMDQPEIVFAGRSNVGKSSLVNALTGRNTLARTSNTPGRTQEINFFDLAGRLRLVDVPGYGFAQAPKAKVEAWTDLVFAYLRGRASLRLACLLIDARHGLKTVDDGAMEQLGRAAVPFMVVLTKADLVRPLELERIVGAVRGGLRNRIGALAEPVLTSSRKGQGIAELRAILATYAAAAERGVSP